MAPLLVLEWCGCTFSFLRCGCTSTSRFSAANHAPSLEKPNFQSPLHMLKIFSQWCAYTFSSQRCGCISTSHFSTTNCAPSPRNPNFQSPLHVLKFFFSMVRLHLLFSKVRLHLHFPFFPLPIVFPLPKNQTFKALSTC